jgi:DNA invertase Pin-like site-specific DNA recombinase
MKHRPRNTGISGAKYRDKRPGLDELLQGVTRRNFDKVMAWSVDRLGRSLADLLAFCNELRAKGVDLYLHQQHLDTSTPSGRAIFAMCGVFAEFEREIIRERINAGLSRAKAQGKTLGRPRLDEDARLAEIRKLRDQGMGILKIARTPISGSRSYSVPYTFRWDKKHLAARFALSLWPIGTAWERPNWSTCRDTRRL